MSSNPTTTREFHLIKVGSYKNLALREAPVVAPSDVQVLVKIHAVSLQYRDIMVTNNLNYPVERPENFVPCSDMAGEVIAVGKDVAEWKSGDRVCANFYHDHIHGDLTPEIQKSGLKSQGSLVAIPDHLSYEEASTLPCAAVTAYNALTGPVPVKCGDFVLIQGTGGVSTFALQIAVASGATVIATSSSDDKLAFAQNLGAKHIINYKKTPNWDEEVLKFTDGRGVDHILEVGGAGTLEKSMKCVRYAGWIHVIGVLACEDPFRFHNQKLKKLVIQADCPNIIPYATRKAVTLRGVHVGSVSQFKALTRLLTSHPGVTRPVIDKIFPFENAVKAWAHLESRKHHGKVVIKVSDN
ncbi:hypothetical protein C8J56DRAFT_1168909 [Mycena floridula]|nr:hypothetical protein C8J56DRAFT_1168909 [Mycena floridula]